jgi:RNA polymerase sigma factor (sigma-70 family)
MELRAHNPSNIGESGPARSAEMGPEFNENTATSWRLDGNLDNALSADTIKSVRRVVSSELLGRRSACVEDVEDVTSDALLAVLSKLEERKCDAHKLPGIRDFDAYVAVIARRACSAWSRRRYPNFHNLRMRLRYLLKNDPELALWEAEGGVWICGRTTDQRTDVTPCLNLSMENISDFDAISRSAKPAKVLMDIFALVGGPMPFNGLAGICAQLWGVKDTPETTEATEIAAKAEVIESTLDGRTRLRRIWEELHTLPERQCAALLLNLRDSDGECATSALIFSGTASMDDLAGLLGISPESFAELWQKLPLNDNEIAERMGITRQQVINLRKCARETLRKRLS